MSQQHLRGSCESLILVLAFLGKGTSKVRVLAYQASCNGSFRCCIACVGDTDFRIMVASSNILATILIVLHASVEIVLFLKKYVINFLDWSNLEIVILKDVKY